MSDRPSRMSLRQGMPWTGRACLCVVAGSLATLALTDSASAATITYSDFAPLADVEVSGVLSVPGFNPALGSLTGVSWEITGAIASILGIENDSSGSISGSATTNVDFDVDSPLLTLPGSPDFSVFGNTGLVNLGVGASAIFPITASTTLTGTEAPSGAFLTPATVDMSFLTTTSFSATGFGGDITVSQATDAGVQLTVTYEYAEPIVPEPSSLALLSLGGLALVRRRNER